MRVRGGGGRGAGGGGGVGVGGGQYKYKLVLVGLFALTGGRGWCCLHHSLCTVVEVENIIMLYGDLS